MNRHYIIGPSVFNGEWGSKIDILYVEFPSRPIEWAMYGTPRPDDLDI
jgi:hypothetical protein